MTTVRPKWTGLLVRLFVVTVLPIALIWFLTFQVDVEPEHALPPLRQARFLGGATSAHQHIPPQSQSVTLPHDWRGAFNGTEGWYFFEVQISESSSPATPWAVYLPRLSTNAAVYFNGEYLGSGGSMNEPVARNWYRPLIFTVPASLGHSGRNELAIRLVSSPMGDGFLAPIYFDQYDRLTTAYGQRLFWNHTALQAIIAALFTATALMLQLWLMRPQMFTYLVFGIGMGAWGLVDLSLIVSHPSVPSMAWEWVNVVGVGLLVICSVAFATRFIDQPSPRAERVMMALWAVGSVAMLPIALRWPQSFEWVRNHVWYAICWLLGFYPIGHLARNCLTDNKHDAWVIILGGWTLSCFGSYDYLLLTGHLSREHGPLMQFAAAVVLTMYAYLLTRRFTAAVKKSEELTQELENRVVEKQGEIEANHVRLRALEQEQAVSAERERLMRDMHDGVGGILASTIMLLQLPNLHLNADRIGDALRRALIDLRLMIDSMDPENGNLVTLIAMFRKRMEPLVEAAGLTNKWHLADFPVCVDLHPAHSLQLLRIAQEALCNAVKHAKASCIEVALMLELDAHGNKVGVLRISDDGCGFAPLRVKGGHGLHNMQQRAQRAGMQLNIESGSKGTEVRITIPSGLRVLTIPN